VSRGRLVFSAVATSVGFAALSYWLFPYGLIEIDSPAERLRVWLLTIWSAGVMAICFGSAGLLTNVTPLGFRDVADAGSTDIALERRGDALKSRSDSIFNFAGWTVATGLGLVLIYFFAVLVVGD
jgi:hypothetical protein